MNSRGSASETSTRRRTVASGRSRQPGTAEGDPVVVDQPAESQRDRGRLVGVGADQPEQPARASRAGRTCGSLERHAVRRLVGRCAGTGISGSVTQDGDDALGADEASGSSCRPPRPPCGSGMTRKNA